MKSNTKYILLLSILLISFSFRAFSQLRLPRLVSDGMVLQREAKTRVWGWASPGENVEVSFHGINRRTTTNAAGEWDVVFDGLKAGGPWDMTISASDTIRVKNILVGDVWVCSGQSNMDVNMERVSPLYGDEIRSAGNPGIRYFSVPASWTFDGPANDLTGGKWEPISQENILSVSAVAYFFAEALYEKYHIPLGIIRSSLGGSPAEAWISEEAIRKFPRYAEEAKKFKDRALIDSIHQADNQRSAAWYSELNERDSGYHSAALIPSYNPEAGVSGLGVMQVPGYWADEGPGEVNGVFWFRRDIELPSLLAGKAAKLNLGRMVDFDSVFVNRTLVGTTASRYPPRRYEIPEGVLKGGKNTIVIRLISNSGKGGFVPDKPYELLVDGQTFDLKGEWHYRLGAAMDPLLPRTFIRWKPTGLYNGMLAPLTHCTIKGVVWYQGESNVSRAVEYRTLFPALIDNWRDIWGEGDFPFLFVQLPNYMERKARPSESEWAMLREAQAGALKLPNTAMAVAIDLGEWNDVHPMRKQDVSRRLALAAEKTAYHEKGIVASGPQYRSMKIRGSRIVLTFSHCGTGLVARDGQNPGGFAIAGKDGTFVWAKAMIHGNKVVVWNDTVENPVAVRYAWADNPDTADLYNREGLPAAPFRTDHWEH